MTKAAIGVFGPTEKRERASRVRTPVCPHVRHSTVTFCSKRERGVRLFSLAALITLSERAQSVWRVILRRRNNRFRCALRAQSRHSRDEVARGDDEARGTYHQDEVRGFRCFYAGGPLPHGAGTHSAQEAEASGSSCSGEAGRGEASGRKNDNPTKRRKIPGQAN